MLKFLLLTASGGAGRAEDRLQAAGGSLCEVSMATVTGSCRLLLPFNRVSRHQVSLRPPYPSCLIGCDVWLSGLLC